MRTAFAGADGFPFAAVPSLIAPALQYCQPAYLLNFGPPDEDPPGYRRLFVYRDCRMELHWLAWAKGSGSPLHGHGDVEAVYWVLSGLLEEERYIADGAGFRYEAQLLQPGVQSPLPPCSYHRVHALAETVSLHWYAPPPETSTVTVPPDVLPLLEAARQRRAAA
jgi:hypothetical protein